MMVPLGTSISKMSKLVKHIIFQRNHFLNKNVSKIMYRKFHWLLMAVTGIPRFPPVPTSNHHGSDQQNLRFLQWPIIYICLSFINTFQIYRCLNSNKCGLYEIFLINSKLIFLQCQNDIKWTWKVFLDVTSETSHIAQIICFYPFQNTMDVAVSQTYLLLNIFSSFVLAHFVIENPFPISLYVMFLPLILIRILLQLLKFQVDMLSFILWLSFNGHSLYTANCGKVLNMVKYSLSYTFYGLSF